MYRPLQWSSLLHAHHPAAMHAFVPVMHASCHKCPLPAMHVPSLPCMSPPCHACPLPDMHAPSLPCMPPCIPILPCTLLPCMPPSPKNLVWRYLEIFKKWIYIQVRRSTHRNLYFHQNELDSIMSLYSQWKVFSKKIPQNLIVLKIYN